MESQRNLLILGLLFVSFLLFQQWQTDTAPAPQQIEETANAANAEIPASTTSNAPATLSNDSERKIITVKTDLIELAIDTLGGDIVESTLLEYPVKLDGTKRLNLLEQQANYQFVAQSGLIGANGPDASSTGRPLYQVAQDSYTLADGQDSLDVTLTYQDQNGVVFEKVFSFARDKYNVKVNYHINNTSSQNIQLQMYGQLKQSVVRPNEESSMMMQLYRGAAYSTQEEKYDKFSYGDMEDSNLKLLTTGGWVAMIQHYFVTAWVPTAEDENHIYSKLVNEEQGIIGYKGSPVTVAANSSATLGATLYTGPKLQDRLEALSETLYLTVDYGFLWWLAKPLHMALTFFHGLVGNWGFAIILLTFAVRGLMYPLTKKQYTSMAKMRQLQPKMAQLKERFGDDRQKMGQATMELYKKEKVNPLGGCLPLLLQMPIFIGLFWMLQESVELRHAPFMLWIDDLSALDPYYVLPLLMGASMWLMAKMQPSMSADPMQQKMMQFMPVIFTVFFLWFPSGLVLYWVVSNVVTLIQQTIIYRAIDKAEAKGKKS
ncbi:membrane protein insertase YidC [Psychrobium sp. 1_MG-2023]|uniref:membrane protein insertase YidC n=1 Tax=Psychrobium sp. 1_MG-2023 TaxID=3062624 RepID=UPI000C336DFE|nr:membrane protein insertase YidC [Psychrobium sp. 1_MG-2023]MDP2560505.1 membrane protein insertase YidC [Psychrobium sp. 1_MG-2023]PKF55201.1 membrane protein insertase YidC [Alteromonadales bacterium alter-6D02]